MSLSRRLSYTIPLWALAGLLASVPAEARPAKPDLTFLKDQTGQLEGLQDSLLAAEGSPAATLGGVRRILAFREDALAQLTERHPLTELDDIETQDLLDDAVVRTIHALVERVEVDSTSIDEVEAFLFAEAMVEVPPLGDSPVGFMVLSFIELAVAASDSVREGAHVAETPSALLALSAARFATDLYVGLDEDVISMDKRSTFRQSSVLFRLRCPKDQGGYGIARQRNQLKSDLGIGRINTMVCTVCGDTLEVTFPLLLPSALNQRTQKQQLKEKPRSPRGSGGVEP